MACILEWAHVTERGSLMGRQLSEWGSQLVCYLVQMMATLMGYKLMTMLVCCLAEKMVINYQRDSMMVCILCSACSKWTVL